MREWKTMGGKERRKEQTSNKSRQVLRNKVILVPNGSQLSFSSGTRQEVV